MNNSRSLTRREVFRTGAGAAAMLALGSRAPAATSGEAVFQVIGDWGFGNENQAKVARAMAEVADANGCDFIISTGDNFYPRGVTSATDEKFRTHFEEPYSALSLRVPWYVALGNHDHNGDIRAQIDYGRLNTRWILPAPYYKRTVRLPGGSTADFFFLDTTPIRREFRSWVRFVYFPSRPQVAWLERELALSNAPWKIVVGHHPLFSGGSHGGTSALVELLQPMFDRYGVQAYLNGHNHNLEHVRMGDVQYLTIGGGSKPTRISAVDGQHFAASRLGFMQARLATEEMHIEFFDEDSRPLYRASIPVGA
jgi:tartrate-resistant acid phosphatase type 5